MSIAFRGAWCMVQTLIFNKRSHLVSLDLGELCVSQSHTTQPKGGFVRTPSNLPVYASKDRSEGAVDMPQKTAVKVQWTRLKRPQ